MVKRSTDQISMFKLKMLLLIPIFGKKPEVTVSFRVALPKMKLKFYLFFLTHY